MYTVKWLLYITNNTIKHLFGFHIALIPIGKVWIQLFPLQQLVNSWAIGFFILCVTICLEEGTVWIHSRYTPLNLTDKMKSSFFQAAVVLILLYRCTTWTLTKLMEKKLDGNYTRMLRAILNKSWQQHLTEHQLYGHLPPITKTIQVRRTRHAGHCWRSRDELISDVLLWTPTYGRANAGRPARTYIQQLCEDTGCGPEDLPEAMNDREKWRERVRDIRAGGTTWWWWWYSAKKKLTLYLLLLVRKIIHAKLNCLK